MDIAIRINVGVRRVLYHVLNHVPVKVNVRSSKSRNQLHLFVGAKRLLRVKLKPLKDLLLSSSDDSNASSSINSSEFADLNLSSATGIYRLFKIPDTIEFETQIVTKYGDLSEENDSV